MSLSLEEKTRLIDTKLLPLLTSIGSAIQSVSSAQDNTAIQEKVRELMSLYHQLTLPSNKTFGHSDDLIPIDLIRFIDDSKAPEVYIQELEELVKKENEQAHGKLGRKGEGIGRFRDKLMQEFQKANK